MARQRLADLVGEETSRPAPQPVANTAPPEPDPPATEPSAAPTDPPPAAAAPPGPERRTSRPKPPPSRPSAGRAVRVDRPVSRIAPSGLDEQDEEFAAQPKYLRLVRKESRLREDQVMDLEHLVLRLNRRRRGGAGERITLNTLLRLGADLLLERAAELAGDTEEELSESLHR